MDGVRASQAETTQLQPVEPVAAGLGLVAVVPNPKLKLMD